VWRSQSCFKTLLKISLPKQRLWHLASTQILRRLQTVLECFPQIRDLACTETVCSETVWLSITFPFPSHYLPPQNTGPYNSFHGSGQFKMSMIMMMMHGDLQCPIHTATPDTMKQSCLCRVWRDGVNWTIAINASRLQYSSPATVLSCRESSPHRRSGRDTDKTVLTCLEWWRCELTFRCRFLCF